VTWSAGLPEATVHLSADALAAFRRGETPEPSSRLTGRRGHYLLQAELTLAPGERRQWHVIADSGLGHAAIEALRHTLRTGDAVAAIERGLAESQDALQRIVASADGVQVTGDEAASVHHHANTLYNAMRGGIFIEHHLVPTADFVAVVRLRHADAASRSRAFLEALPTTLPVQELITRAAASG
jgi:hypothetical protein